MHVLSTAIVPGTASSLPFNVRELLLVVQRAAALLRPHGEQDEEGQEEDGENRTHDHRDGDQDFRRQMFCEEEET